MKKAQIEKMRAGREAKGKVERKTFTHTVRTRDGGTKTFQKYTKGMAMKLMCTECLGWEREKGERCTSPLCPLFPFQKHTQMAFHRD